MARAFALIPRADELPGHCVRCPGKNNLIEFGADGIPGYGIVYLCLECFRELAQGMRYIEASLVQQSTEELLTKIHELEDRPPTYITTFTRADQEVVHGLVDLLPRLAAAVRGADDGAVVPAPAGPAGPDPVSGGPVEAVHGVDGGDGTLPAGEPGSVDGSDLGTPVDHVAGAAALPDGDHADDEGRVGGVDPWDLVASHTDDQDPR